MQLRVVGAGLPRTGTESLRFALQRLLGGPCYHMRVIPGHPFDLGPDWQAAMAGRPDWGRIYAGYVAAVDWPTSMFWAELAAAYPDALVVLSVRNSATTWLESAEATILPPARRAPEPFGRNDLTRLFERFTGTRDWDDPAVLRSAYERHEAAVTGAVPPSRLLRWEPIDGWRPLCSRLGVPEPAEDFPSRNQREQWE